MLYPRLCWCACSRGAVKVVAYFAGLGNFLLGRARRVCPFYASLVPVRCGFRVGVGLLFLLGFEVGFWASHRWGFGWMRLARLNWKGRSITFCGGIDLSFFSFFFSREYSGRSFFSINTVRNYQYDKESVFHSVQAAVIFDYAKILFQSKIYSV